MDALEQFLGGEDTVRFADATALKLDPDVTVVPGVQDDLHHAQEVGVGFVPLVIEGVALGTHRLGEGHQLHDAQIAIVVLATAQMEIAKVGQRTASRQINRLHHGRQPSSVGG